MPPISVFLHRLMNKTMLALFLSAITWTSCIKEKTVQPLTKKQIQQQVDSIVAARTKTLIEYCQRDLNYRMKIEVKVKADSLLKARQTPVNDTANKVIKP